LVFRHCDLEVGGCGSGFWVSGKSIGFRVKGFRLTV